MTVKVHEIVAVVTTATIAIEGPKAHEHIMASYAQWTIETTRKEKQDREKNPKGNILGDMEAALFTVKVSKPLLFQKNSMTFNFSLSTVFQPLNRTGQD